MSDAHSGWCDHCDLPRATCVHSVVVTEDRPLTTGPTITASTNSPCEHCGDLMVGTEDRITYTEIGWTHARCAAPAPGPTPPPTDLFRGF